MKVHANTKKCYRCGKQAEVWWPMIDPDITPHPYCNQCCREAVIQVMIMEADERLGSKK